MPQRTAALRSMAQPTCKALHLSNLCCKSSSCVPCQREVAPVPGSFCVRGRTEHGRSLIAARNLDSGVCIAELYGAPFSADDPRAYTHAGFAVQVTGGVRVIPHDSCAARYANHSENNPQPCAACKSLVGTGISGPVPPPHPAYHAPHSMRRRVPHIQI